MEKEKDNTNAAEDHTDKLFAAQANPTYLAEFWRAFSHRQYSIKTLVVGPHVLIDIFIFEAKQRRVHWSELSPNGKLYLVLSPNWAVSRLYLKPPMLLLS